MPEEILILDFGSQYTQVIARRIREQQVFGAIARFDLDAESIRARRPKGIILSGGPASVYAEGAPMPDPEIFNLGIPILGICYGLQVIAKCLGGGVEPSSRREYGKGQLHIKRESPLLDGLNSPAQVWNSHSDRIVRLPDGFETSAITENSEHAVIEDAQRRFYGIQFHPEVVHTPQGSTILENFAREICECSPNWTMRGFIEQAVEEIRNTVGDHSVILGLSGGVDSSVAAALVHQAIGDQLTCIFVNNGLLRAKEADRVQKLYRDHFAANLVYEDASQLFLDRLASETDPEKKRKIIGETFIDVFKNATQKVGSAKFLAQGTLYPDIIESVPIDGNPAAKIKSHHNVGGLPEDMPFELIEPLSRLFKDEVREVGRELGLPKEAVDRHPFPGPGLAIRIMGEVTEERLRSVRCADTIVLEEMKRSGWYDKVWQSFAVLLPVRSVGVMGDLRTYENTAAIRIVESRDGMTADWVRVPYEILETISTRIINEAPGINRVCFDISSKPPATIEWE